METLKTKLSTIEEELRVVSNLDKLRSDAAEKRRLLEAEHLSLGARKTASLQNANSVQVSTHYYSKSADPLKSHDLKVASVFVDTALPDILTFRRSRFHQKGTLLTRKLSFLISLSKSYKKY